MRPFNRVKSYKQRTRSFSPDKSFVEAAIDVYLKNGGRITLLKADDKNLKDFTAKKEFSSAVDEFLSGF